MEEIAGHMFAGHLQSVVGGTGGEICFFATISITPIITLTGARWIAPLRRRYGVMFAVIGIADAITAAITGDFAGGVFGRLAGHTFLLAGLLVILLALPLLATANTSAQRKLGKYWKRPHRVTYVIWGLLVVHLLLDGLMPFGASDGDGDPVFHQRFYQAVAISIPLIVLRLPPVRHWITKQRAAGRQARVWLAIAPLAALFITGFLFIINEEIFTGTMAFMLHPQQTDASLDRDGCRGSATAVRFPWHDDCLTLNRQRIPRDGRRSSPPGPRPTREA